MINVRKEALKAADVLDDAAEIASTDQEKGLFILAAQIVRELSAYCPTEKPELKVVR